MYPEAPRPLPFPYRPTISLFDFTHYILYNLAVLPIMGIFYLENCGVSKRYKSLCNFSCNRWDRPIKCRVQWIGVYNWFQHTVIAKVA